MTKTLSSFSEVKAVDEEQVVVIEGNEPFRFNRVKQVYSYDKDYIVYRVDEGKIIYQVTNKIDNNSRELSEVRLNVQSVISISRRNVKDNENSILCTIANSITSGIIGNYTDARRYIENAEDKIKTESASRVKKFYFPAALVSSLLVAIIGILALQQTDINQEKETVHLGLILTTSLIGGSIGALLSSTILRSGKNLFDPFGKPGWAVFSGVSRVILGVASAFLLVLAFDLGVFSSNLIPENLSTGSYIFVGAIGGFFERMAMDIMGTFKGNKS